MPAQHTLDVLPCSINFNLNLNMGSIAPTLEYSSAFLNTVSSHYLLHTDKCCVKPRLQLYALLHKLCPSDCFIPFCFHSLFLFALIQDIAPAMAGEGWLHAASPVSGCFT